MLEYNIDTGCDGNLVPVNMFKVLFQETSLAELAWYENEEVTLCTYNSSCIPQLGVCKVKIMHKEKSYRFFVVPGGPALLGMLDAGNTRTAKCEL